MTGRLGAAGAVRAVLFDLDGVLIDSYHAWFAVVNDAARSFGSPEVTLERFQSVWGQGIGADVRNLYPGRTHRDVEEAYERAMAQQTDTIMVNPESAATLDDLKALGLARACVTNTQIGLARTVLTASGLLSRFESIQGMAPDRREKPAPDLLLAALEALRVAPRDALMVGDSRYDEGAAEAAKVRFLHYDMREGGSLKAALTLALNARA